MNNDNPAGTTPELSSQTVSAKQSWLISKVLSPAVGLWLRSQVQQVSDLEVKISGSNRQIFSGHIPGVSVSASQAVYQGLHLTQIQFVGEGIRVNLAAVLKGQPLRLLEPVPLFCKLLVQELDLNASLASPLLANALTELLLTRLPASFPVDGPVTWHKISIDSGHLTAAATIAGVDDHPKSVVIRTGLNLASNRELQLENFQLQTQLGKESENLASFKLDLGPEAAIEELTLTPGQLVCRGRIKLIPAVDEESS